MILHIYRHEGRIDKKKKYDREVKRLNKGYLIEKLLILIMKKKARTMIHKTI